MTRALFLRLPTIAAVTLVLCLIPKSSVAQHGGGGGFHGGGAGFHSGGFGGGFHGGGSFHSGGFGGGFHGGGSFHGGGFGGFNGGGFHRGFGGFPNRFGRGWGWGGWGWGWGWGWGLGWWGWPWWYGYPSNWGPSAYGCPNYVSPYYGYCDPYSSPGYGPGSVDPPSNGPGNYPRGNNSEPDWRHEPGPNQQPNNVQPDEDEPKPSHSSPSISSPDSSLIIVQYVTRPTSDDRMLGSGRSRPHFALSSSEPGLPKLRRSVQNAIILLRTMPPSARERWLASGRYSKFSPEEQQLLREYAGAASN